MRIMKQNRRFHLGLLTLMLMAAGMLCFIINAPGCSRNNQSLTGVWISGGEDMTIPSTGRHARYFVEYEFKPDGTYRSTDYTIYDDGTIVEGSKTYSLNNGTYRLEKSRLFYTHQGSTEQEYGVAIEAGSLKLITSTSVQVFQRKDGRFAE